MRSEETDKIAVRARTITRLAPAPLPRRTRNLKSEPSAQPVGPAIGGSMECTTSACISASVAMCAAVNVRLVSTSKSSAASGRKWRAMGRSAEARAAG